MPVKPKRASKPSSKRPKKKAAKKTPAKKKAAKKKAAKKPASRAKPAKKKKTKKKSAKKKSAKKKSAKKKTTKKKSAAKKKSSRAKPAKKKSAKKKTAVKKPPPRVAKKAAAKKATKKKTARSSARPVRKRGASATKKGMLPSRSLDPAAQLDHVLEQLRLVQHLEGDAPEALPELIDRFEAIATADALPRMLALLEDEDPHGVGWSVFYVMERFDDDYLAALLAGLDALAARSPTWAEVAVIRVLNTRGDPEDCTDAFIRLAKRANKAARDALAELLERLASHAELTDDQRELVAWATAQLGTRASATRRTRARPART